MNSSVCLNLPRGCDNSVEWPHTTGAVAVQLDASTRTSKSRVLLSVSALLALRLIIGGVVAVEVPHKILRGHPGKPFAEFVALSLAGVFLTAVGLMGYLRCAYDFVVAGSAFTPSNLAVQGTYGLVRNPMCLGLILVLLGESFFFKSWWLLAYTATLALIAHITVVVFEEPQMLEKWGNDYLRYCERVPRWIPRFTRPTT